MLSVNLQSVADSPTRLALTFTLDFAQGPVAITGPSGSGKTTLLRVLAGLEQRFTGEIYLADQCVWSKTRNLAPHKRHIGLVFQQPILFEHLDVFGNLQFAYRRAPAALFTIQQVATWCGLSSLMTQPIQQLSGGQRQRVALARALLNQPDLLLLDEPFSGIDTHNRRQLIQVLQQIQQDTQMPMIMVSHQLDDIRLLCHQLLVMEAGHIVAQGQTLPILNQYQTESLLGQTVTATLSCTLVASYPQEGWLMLDVEQQSIEACSDLSGSIGQEVVVMISADQVSVSIDRPPHSSMNNYLSVCLDKVTVLDPSYQLLHLTLGQQVILCKILKKSARDLGLQLQMRLFAQFNANAVILI